jgi:hypothetical protein
LTIISGCIGIGIGIYVAVLGEVIGGMAGLAGMGGLAGIFAALGCAAIGIGVVALIGGIFTLKRRLWGLALTGAILAILCGGVLGILATIFVSKGRKEFA